MASKIIILLSLLFCPRIYGWNKIVGGFETNIENVPYQAALQYYRAIISPLCGAAIISTRYLLSAAQCHPGRDLNVLYARIGSTSYESGGQFLRVAAFLKHPDFNEVTLDYDFAVVSFSGGAQIQLGPTTAVIPLASVTDLIDGSMMVVSGWGLVSSSATSIPTNLREVTMPVINQDVCRGMHYDFLSPRQICFGGQGQGVCRFDFGGPAVQNGTLYALISGGNSCEQPNVPGIYSRISTVREWIFSLTGV